MNDFVPIHLYLASTSSPIVVGKNHWAFRHSEGTSSERGNRTSGRCKDGWKDSFHPSLYSYTMDFGVR